MIETKQKRRLYNSITDYRSSSYVVYLFTDVRFMHKTH